jgi:hypothetical protein
MTPFRTPRHTIAARDGHGIGGRVGGMAGIGNRGTVATIAAGAVPAGIPASVNVSPKRLAAAF